MWVSWGFLVRICFTATRFLEDLWNANQTTLNPPLPSKPIRLNLSGNRYPNLEYSSAVRRTLTLKVLPSRLSCIIVYRWLILTVSYSFLGDWISSTERGLVWYFIGLKSACFHGMSTVAVCIERYFTLFINFLNWLFVIDFYFQCFWSKAFPLTFWGCNSSKGLKLVLIGEGVRFG